MLQRNPRRVSVSLKKGKEGVRNHRPAGLASIDSVNQFLAEFESGLSGQLASTWKISRIGSLSTRLAR